MDMNDLSLRAREAKESLLSRSAGKLAEDVIDLSVGDPCYETPEPVNEAAIKAIREGFTHYTPSCGTEELRRLAAQDFCQTGVSATKENTVVSHGAKPLLAAAVWALCNERDSFWVPSPFYPPFPALVKTYGGTVRTVGTRHNRFALDCEELLAFLERDRNRRHRVIINSPNNPTGMVWDLTALTKAREDVVFIADESYREICYRPPIASLAALPGMARRTVTIRSCSKTYAMTGWRIGYLTGPQVIVDKIRVFLDMAGGCPCSISQKAAVAAFQTDFVYTGRMMTDLSEKRDVLEKWLSNKRIIHPYPDGAFYFFVDLSRWGGSEDISRTLLQEARVRVVPGSVFGSEGDWEGWARISYASVSLQQLEEALSRMDKVLF